MHSWKGNKIFPSHVTKICECLFFLYTQDDTTSTSSIGGGQSGTDNGPLTGLGHTHWSLVVVEAFGQVVVVVVKSVVIDTTVHHVTRTIQVQGQSEVATEQVQIDGFCDGLLQCLLFL